MLKQFNQEVCNNLHMWFEWRKEKVHKFILTDPSEYGPRKFKKEMRNNFKINLRSNLQNCGLNLNGKFWYLGCQTTSLKIQWIKDVWMEGRIEGLTAKNIPEKIWLIDEQNEIKLLVQNDIFVAHIVRFIKCNI